jgi:hypothetical protein
MGFPCILTPRGISCHAMLIDLLRGSPETSGHGDLPPARPGGPGGAAFPDLSERSYANYLERR